MSVTHEPRFKTAYADKYCISPYTALFGLGVFFYFVRSFHTSMVLIIPAVCTILSYFTDVHVAYVPLVALRIVTSDLILIAVGYFSTNYSKVPILLPPTQNVLPQSDVEHWDDYNAVYFYLLVGLTTFSIYTFLCITVLFVVWCFKVSPQISEQCISLISSGICMTMFLIVSVGFAFGGYYVFVL
uniref:Conserved plasma membrane protein n=1 Tax=Panagrellus redivivus TaxID=6233 RepID=A0A7E4ZSN1_PANRE